MVSFFTLNSQNSGDPKAYPPQHPPCKTSFLIQSSYNQISPRDPPPPPILKSFWIHACVLTFKLKMIKRGSVIVLLNDTISYNILLNIRYYILYCIVYFDYIWYRLIYHMIQHDIISYDTIWSHIKLNNVILHHIIFTMYDIVLYQLI